MPGNIFEFCTHEVERSAQNGCRPHPSRPGSSPGQCYWRGTKPVQELQDRINSHSSASACLNDRVREAAKWLQAALDGGSLFAKLHLAHLTFIAGQEDAALAHLKENLSRRVQRGRDTCASLGEWANKPMLTCSGCRVARFCSADHQKMASKKAAWSLWTGRHKDICGALGKWREVCQRRCGA